jgi:50S ribosomal protein L16 3-hydroxylase
MLDSPCTLLGGLTPAQFMRRHWQKKPLLVRGAAPDAAPLARGALFGLAARDDVESRLVQRNGALWRLQQGPLARRRLPALSQPGWTLLVQGVDLHVDAAQRLLDRFAFIPAARLDDLMISYASDGGGVGAHLDSYDVFLLQVQGQRRWRWGRVARPQWRDDVPLKLLAHFDPTHDELLGPGDLLYLPPGWGHDGTAVGGDCMTCSIGFRSPARGELLRELLPRMADQLAQQLADEALRYRDPAQPATTQPGALPAALVDFAQQAVQRALQDPALLRGALGGWLSEPKPQVWFDRVTPLVAGNAVRLDRRTRMLYDTQRVYINGESMPAGGPGGRLLRRLADRRRLSAAECRAASANMRATLADWAEAGWLHDAGDADE